MITLLKTIMILIYNVNICAIVAKDNRHLLDLFDRNSLDQKQRKLTLSNR